MIWIPTERLRFKVILAERIKGICGGDWDLNRAPLADLPKHRAVVEHFVNGIPWEQTELFRDNYQRRFDRGDRVHRARDMKALIKHYNRYIDKVFQSLKENGFLTNQPRPQVFIGHDGEPMLWNQGNHRVAMAKIIGIEQIPCDVCCRHEGWKG